MPVGRLYLSSKTYDEPKMIFNKKYGIEIHFPNNVLATHPFLQYLDYLLIPTQTKMVSSIYIKLIYLDEKIHQSLKERLSKITEEVMSEYGMNNITKPFVYYRVQVNFFIF